MEGEEDKPKQRDGRDRVEERIQREERRIQLALVGRILMLMLTNEKVTLTGGKADLIKEHSMN